jgi:hypothetical protein
VIEVKRSAGDEWVVSVKAEIATHHHVRLLKADLDRLAQGRSAEDLLRESFRFLLEHEPNTSILHSFDLMVISHYFPDYEEEIKARLQQAN